MEYYHNQQISCLSLEFSSFDHINFLIGTRHHRFIKEHVLIRLSGEDYRITL
ncbi:hypothetical protein NC652_038268 [Populus alba x Populus x berolinensis]|nr:hypothetical protein NC652_038268 [Populus alba x Populus x berolinensis]